MNILFVLENYLPHIGGVEILFMNLAERLVKKGHDVSIVTHRMKNSLNYEQINGVKVYRVGCLGSRYLFTFLSIGKVLKLAGKADIIHTTTFNGAPPSWLASKLKKKPSVITVHEVWIGKWNELTEMSWFNSLIHDLLERFIYGLSFDRYVSVSNSTKRALEKIRKKDKKKIQTIYNGVDYEHWNPKKYDRKKTREKLGLKDEFLLFCYGRPGVSKGIEYVIEAMPKILQTISNAKLLLVLSKDPAYKKRYEMIKNRIIGLGIKDKVILKDPVSYNELPNFHKASDCVIIPSLSEGFGFTAAESVAMQVPVIATDNASLPEVVSGKFLLIPPKDKDEIAKAIGKIYDKKYNKTNIKRFEWSETVKNYIDLYEVLLKKFKK
jgi:D-inositol-3-phosphate glycosyltransferase